MLSWQPKKISEKYKEIREGKARKKFILPGEQVKIETIKTDNGKVKAFRISDCSLS